MVDGTLLDLPGLDVPQDRMGVAADPLGCGLKRDPLLALLQALADRRLVKPPATIPLLGTQPATPGQVGDVRRCEPQDLRGLAGREPTMWCCHTQMLEPGPAPCG